MREAEHGINSEPQTGVRVLSEERQKQLELIELLESWMADDSGEDARLWPLVKAGLEANRALGRPLFELTCG